MMMVKPGMFLRHKSSNLKLRVTSVDAVYVTLESSSSGGSEISECIEDLKLQYEVCSVKKGSIWEKGSTLAKVTSFLWNEDRVLLRGEDDKEIIAPLRDLEQERDGWREISPTRVYFAATFARQAEMRSLRDKLPIMYVCNSRWLDQEKSNLNKTLAIGDRMKAAQDDLEDVMSCDMMLVFVDDPKHLPPTGGGRHVELGIFLGRRASKPETEQLFMIGTKDSEVSIEHGHENVQGECIFHSLVDATFAGFNSWLSAHGKGYL